ncbi:MAG: RagB/SusD family nutrient uptake outer membrane protein, partial [Odoribacter sp.]|nr:RagB/SusD family nutrient uptake outer membrane protein [Odoribacter sp.]
RRWKTAHEEMNDKLYGWNVLGESATQFYNNFEGPVVVWDKLKFVSPRDYLFPIRSEEVVVSNYVQNPGW